MPAVIVHELEPAVGFSGSRTFVIGSKPVGQAIVFSTILTLDGVGERKNLSASNNWTFPLVGYSLIVCGIAYSINMGFPSDVRVFIRNQAYSFSTYRANDNTGTLVISIRAFVLSITSMLKTKHL